MSVERATSSIPSDTNGYLVKMYLLIGDEENPTSCNSGWIVTGEDGSGVEAWNVALGYVIGNRMWRKQIESKIRRDRMGCASHTDETVYVLGTVSPIEDGVVQQASVLDITPEPIPIEIKRGDDGIELVWNISETGPNLTRTNYTTRGYACYLKVLDDGSYEPVALEDGKMAERYLGVIDEATGLVTTNSTIPWTRSVLDRQLILFPEIDRVARRIRREENEKWKRLNASSDIIEIRAVKSEKTYEGRNRSFLGHPNLEPEWTLVKEEPKEVKVLARIPISHYKNGRHAIQWKKSVDADGSPVNL